MNADTVTCDQATISAFLTEIYRGVTDGVVALNRRILKETTGTDKDAIGTNWFQPNQLDAMAAEAAERGQSTCIWFGVATRRTRLSWGKRGGIKDCLAIPALWADLDVDGLRTTLDGQVASGHGPDAVLYPSLDAAHEALDQFPIAPSIVVESGGGLQPYWLLDEPHLLDGSNLLARFRATWKDRAGNLADAVFNADRIMRVPGTVNHKRGLVPVPVTIADTGAPPIRHRVIDLLELLDHPPARNTPPSSNGHRPQRNTDEPSWVSEVVADYNTRTPWAEVLAGEFEHLGQNGHMHEWHAVGAENDVGATTNAKNSDRLVVFSHTAGHRTGWRVHGTEDTTTSYDKFSARMLIETGKDPVDDTAARVEFARHLRDRGYGPDEWGFVGDPDDGSTPDRKPLPAPVAFDDSHMGAAFGKVITGRFLYCAELGGWHRWDGRRWARDTTEAVYEICRRYVLALGAQMFRGGADGDQLKKVAAYRAMTKIAAVVLAARRLRGIAATASEFDNHPDLLNVRNGVVDLRTGQIEPHDPELRITKLANVDYRPDATHPDVDAVLKVVDEPVRDWLQVFTGYSATGHVTEDLMPFWDGTGSNGKTTLLGAVSAALGEYASTASPRLLMRGAHDAHPTIFADLFGRRLVTIEETAEGGSLAVETMKALTGGSKIKAHFMRRDQFEFVTTHQLVVATNHRPAVNSTDHATWRRLRLVPFPYRYTNPAAARPGDRVIDKDLRARLQTGRQQREAMLAWIVAGAVRWATSGLPDCPEIDDATEEWRNSEDAIYRFVTERCVTGPGASVRSSELHREYTSWCEAEGRPAASNKEFSKRLRDHDLAAAHGIELRKTSTSNTWFGLGIKEWL